MKKKTKKQKNKKTKKQKNNKKQKNKKTKKQKNNKKQKKNKKIFFYVCISYMKILLSYKFTILIT